MHPVPAALLASAMLLVSACGGAKDGRGASGPNYSSTPCSENCGNDTQCQASCQNVSNQQPLPAGSQPGK